MVAQRPRPAQADSSAKTRLPAPGDVDFGYGIPEVMALMPPASGIKLGRESKWQTRGRVTYPGEPARTTSVTFGPSRLWCESLDSHSKGRTAAADLFAGRVARKIGGAIVRGALNCPERFVCTGRCLQHIIYDACVHSVCV